MNASLAKLPESCITINSFDSLRANSAASFGDATQLIPVPLGTLIYDADDGTLMGRPSAAYQSECRPGGPYGALK